MKRLVEWWNDQPARSKVIDLFWLAEIPFWFVADIKWPYAITVAIVLAFANVLVAYLVCDYFGWTE